MSTGYDSLAAQLAAAILGPATNDPLWGALMNGAARVGEIGQTGFDTSTPFDNVNQAMYVGKDRMPFLLVSLGTSTTYYVLVVEHNVGSVLRAAIAVHEEGQVPDMEYLNPMTLTRNADGNVHAAPGW